MTRRRFSSLVLVFMLLFSLTPLGLVHAAGTDDIKRYAIDILPQEDGSLMDTYAINWCVISNAAGPLTWISLGMPNEQYQIVSSSGDVTTVSPNDEGFNYKIRIDLPRQVNSGDCVNLSVQIHQYGMANLDSSTKEISFQFTPGWFNDVPVDLLQVTWHLPSDGSLLKSLDPKPSRQDASQAVWETNLQPGEKFPVTIVYDQAAFPGFTPGQAAPTTASLPTNPGQSSTSPGSSDNTGSPSSSSPAIIPGISLLGGSLTATSCICICLVALLILFVLFMVIRAFGSGGRSYTSGGWLGGYPRGGGWLGGGGGGGLGGGFGSLGGGGGSFTPRTGGGSGLFGGRGMSCACVSSGCACACAGGGRAGCSRKGFDVSSLFKDRQEKSTQ